MPRVPGRWVVDGRWLFFLLFVPKLLICAPAPFWAISPPPGARCLAPSLAPQSLGGTGWELGEGSQRPGGLQLTEAHCWFQLVGQGSEDLVKLLVALSLAALGPAAAPEQPQLELGAEDLQQLRSALETCRERESQSHGEETGTLLPWDALSSAGLELTQLHTGNVVEGKGICHPHCLPCSFTSALVW